MRLEGDWDASKAGVCMRLPFHSKWRVELTAGKSRDAWTKIISEFYFIKLDLYPIFHHLLLKLTSAFDYNLDVETDNKVATFSWKLFVFGSTV